MSRPLLLTACALGALLPLASAQQEAAGPAGTLRTVDGRSFTGALTVAEDRATVTATDGTTTTLDVAELVAFERADANPRNVQVEDRVWLRSGQELPAKKLDGKPAADGKPALLVATLPSGTVVELPISTLRALRHGGTMRPRPNLFLGDLANPAASDDFIYVTKDGKQQRSSVIVTGIDSRRIDFLLRGEPYEFELDGLCGVVFGANTGFPPDRQPRPRTVMALTTGERIEGKLLSVGENVRLRLDEGFVVDVPVRKLHRLDVSSDRLVWLTELPPKVEQTAAFDRVWPWHADRSTAGPGFELGGQTYERGIGLVPRTRLTYDLEGRFDMFEAMIGIDDRGGPEAHAIFRVHVDGKQVFESQPKTRGEPPQAVKIPLNKARSFAIEVDFGKNYDLGDFCAFADARVVQQ